MRTRDDEGQDKEDKDAGGRMRDKYDARQQHNLRMRRTRTMTPDVYDNGQRGRWRTRTTNKTRMQEEG
jgi:hypothetical protein